MKVVLLCALFYFHLDCAFMDGCTNYPGTVDVDFRNYTPN